MSKLLAIYFLLSLSLASAGHATVFTFDQLDFVADTQSLWESGGSINDFGSSGNELGIGYDIGASSGTVSGLFQGELSADYTPYVSGLGATSINLRFQGAGAGQINSELGAWANLEFLGIDVIDWNAMLDIDMSFSPQLDQEVLGSDAITVTNVGLNAGVIKLGASIAIEQENSFTATGIDGLLAYSQRGSGITTFTTFNNLTDANGNFDVLLTDYGIWDFWVEDISLDNLFNTSFDARLFAYEEHVDGVDFTRRCVGRSWWETCWWVPETTFSRNEITLADIDLYDGDYFPLDFHRINDTNGFSITVPEPSTLVMLALGLAGLRFRGRKRLQ